MSLVVFKLNQILEHYVEARIIQDAMLHNEYITG